MRLVGLSLTKSMITFFVKQVYYKFFIKFLILPIKFLNDKCVNK